MKLYQLWTRIIVIFAIVAMLIAVWDQSVNGRQNVIDATRQRCYVTSYTTALLANVLRRDQETFKELGKTKAIHNPVRSDLSKAAIDDNTLLLAVDRSIDPAAANKALNPIGRKYIDSLGKKAYSCKKAIPDASPFQFGSVLSNFRTGK